MATVKFFSDLDGNVKNVELKNTKLIEKKVNKQAIFDSIIVENASERQGTHSTLSKGEVRGGGRKPYRQKHTGRARQGSIRNPQWVGGGVAFGVTPNKNYKIKLNSKISKLAFRSAITLKINDNELNLLVNKVELKKPSTKTISTFIKKINLVDKKVLIVLNEQHENFIKSCWNIPTINPKLWNQVSVKDIINSDIAIIQEDAFNKISEVFK
ncbi:50S ribosomal protein L4 [Malacoplasma muris]|uniref:50S ribosomal protein L4 n=1 Tax=Malacoplasma muris TaxID=2119 RepID=UPI00398F0C4D